MIYSVHHHGREDRQKSDSDGSIKGVEVLVVPPHGRQKATGCRIAPIYTQGYFIEQKRTNPNKMNRT